MAGLEREMRRLLLLVCLLAGIASAQPATMATGPCRMDGVGCPTQVPVQTGHSGKYLYTNGLTASWEAVVAGVSGSGASGRLALWSSASGLTSDSGLTYSGTGTGAVLRIGSAGTGLSEISAGVLGVGTGAAGSTAGTLKATTVDLGNNITITSPSANVITFGTSKTDFTFYSLDGNTSAGFISGGAAYGNVLAATFGGTSTYTVPLHASNFIVGSTYGSATYASLDSNQLTLNGVGSKVYLRGESSATLKHGAADSATPVAQTIAFQGSRGGTDTNTAGVDATIQGSLGTGTAASGKIVFKVGTPQATGTTQHVPAAVLTLQDTGTGGTAEPTAVFAGGATFGAPLQSTAYTGAAELIQLGSSSAIAWGVTGVVSGHRLYPNPTDTRDIGLSSLQIRSLYLANSTLGSKSKTLADATPTAFATIPLATGAATGGKLIYRVVATDGGTARQVVSGSINYAAVRDGATYAVDYDEIQQSTAVTSGTLTGAVTAAGASDLLTFSANFDTDLGTPVLTIYYRFDSTDTLAVTGL